MCYEYDDEEEDDEIFSIIPLLPEEGEYDESNNEYDDFEDEAFDIDF